MRDFEEELADIAGPPFAVTVAGVDQFSSGKQPRALVALVERSERLDWLQQKVTDGRPQLRHRGRAPQVSARTSPWRASRLAPRPAITSPSSWPATALSVWSPWIAEHFSLLFEPAAATAGRVYITEADLRSDLLER